MTQDNLMIIIAFALYLGLMMYIGVYYYRKSNSIGDNAAPDKTINVVAILIFLWFLFFILTVYFLSILPENLHTPKL